MMFDESEKSTLLTILNKKLSEIQKYKKLVSNPVGLLKHESRVIGIKTQLQNNTITSIACCDLCNFIEQEISKLESQEKLRLTNFRGNQSKQNLYNILQKLK